MASVIANSTAGRVAGLPERCLGRDESREREFLEEEVLKLFDRMRARLLRYAIGFGISIPDGEDVVQETFLALFHHLRRGRPRHNLHGWLFQVVHNLSLKRRMRAVREAAGTIPEEFERPAPDPNPEECLLIGERRARLQAVLSVLPFDDRLCLRLRAEGLRYREIARIAGISLGGVSASLRRSFARLEEADRREARVR